MKIAFVTDTYLPTINGVTYTIHDWKEEMEEQGHDVDVVCPSPGSEDGDEVLFRSVRFPFYEGFRAPIFPPVSHDFSDYDVIHTHSFFLAGLYGYYLSWRHGIPLVTHVHTPIEDFLDYVSSWNIFKRAAEKLYKAWEKRMIESSDLCLTPTEGRKKDLEERTSKEVHVISNGVDTEFFSEVDASKFVKEHGLESDLLLGYTGRLGSEKRLEELFDVSERLNAEVVVGGDGPMREEYERITQDREDVIFLGFMDRDRIPQLYSALDVFVFPSRVEAEGLVVLEANACGTPVVGADAKGLKSSIENGVNGYRYEPGDIDDLEHSIEKAIEREDELKESSKQKAASKSIGSTVEKLISMYRKVCEGESIK